MMEKLDSQKPEPRSVDSLRPEELEQYSQVPGWRIWPRNIFQSTNYTEAAENAGAKPNALISREFDRDAAAGYDLYNLLLHNWREASHIPSIIGRGSFDLPWFILEPLTEEEVKIIDQQEKTHSMPAAADKPKQILRAEALKGIFSPNTT